MSAHEHGADVAMAPADPDEKKQKKEHGHGHGHEHDHANTHRPGDGVVSLGTVTAGGATFVIDRDGQIEAGKTTEFGVELAPGSAAVVPKAAWLANPDGKKLCDPVAGDGHDDHWHFNVCPLHPVKKSKFVLQVGGEEAAVDFARGHAPCNGGIMSVFKASHAPQWRGYLELKLHGDAGDLEMWLYTSAEGGRKPLPFDLPKETVLTLAFPNHGGKTLEMRVRNGEQNEDEDGTPNMRAGETNYFIFPGESGQDPEWLVGEKWRGLATVAFAADGNSYACDPFVLVPHS